jgi:hypothetical protein
MCGSRSETKGNQICQNPFSSSQVMTRSPAWHMSFGSKAPNRQARTLSSGLRPSNVYAPRLCRRRASSRLGKLRKVTSHAARLLSPGRRSRRRRGGRWRLFPKDPGLPSALEPLPKARSSKSLEICRRGRAIQSCRKARRDTLGPPLRPRVIGSAADPRGGVGETMKSLGARANKPPADNRARSSQPEARKAIYEHNPWP